MDNVVKRKLCWSSKNKDLHACNALSFSVFLFCFGFLFISCVKSSTLCMSEPDVYKYQSDTPQLSVSSSETDSYYIKFCILYLYNYR